MPIFERSTQKVLTPENGVDGTGTVVLRDFSQGPGQRWIPESLDDGNFRIIHAPSGKVLDVAGGSVDAGASLLCWGWHGGDNQRFKYDLDTGTLTAYHSGRQIGVKLAPGMFPPDVMDEAPVVQGEANGVDFGHYAGRYRFFGEEVQAANGTAKVWDVVQASQDNGERVIMWNRTHGKNQKFSFERVAGTALYRIIAQHSGKVLDIEGASMDPGARLIQWDWHGGKNQMFAIGRSHSDYGRYVIRAEHSGMTIQILGHSDNSGAELGQAPYEETQYQCWLF
ncbi:RICIN domain-containing protein [Streptomyces chartreusis]|uniref:RICIN domain-containing protein n=1 Tax=Streptomyces chartreusis TaxID=1969 RepID=UPI0036C5F8DB